MNLEELLPLTSALGLTKEEALAIYQKETQDAQEKAEREREKAEREEKIFELNLQLAAYA